MRDLDLFSPGASLENPLMAFPVESYLESQRLVDYPKTVFPYQLCIALLPLIDLLSVRPRPQPRKPPVRCATHF